MLLSWFVDEVTSQAALDGILIDEDKVECMPEKIPMALLDENVDVYLIRKYFTADAWLVIEDVLKQKKGNPTWMCEICHKNLSLDQSIGCDSCLKWFHFKCAGITKYPKKKTWFCRPCHA